MGWIFYLSAQPDLPHVGTGWLDLVASWGAHFLLFGVLAILWMRALSSRPHAALMAFTLTALYALTDEFHQAFVPGRHPSVADLVFDMAGAALGLWVYSRMRSLSGPRPTP